MNYETENNMNAEAEELNNDSQENQAWEDTTQSEMAGAESAEQAYALPQKKSLNRGTVILLASCLLGVGAIFFLRQQPEVTSVENKEVEARVDTALAKLGKDTIQDNTKQVFEDTEEMVRVFYEYPAKQQVSVDELQRNPFSSLLVKDPGAKDVDDALERQARLREELTKKLNALELQSVIPTGAGGAQCMISGEVYSEGELVDIFKIKSIKQGQVLLMANEMDFTLKL
jgi:hypothetical protein